MAKIFVISIYLANLTYIYLIYGFVFVLPASPPPPPRRKRRRTQRQDAMEELREFIRVEKVEAERERLRLEQQRAADEEWQRQTVLYRQQQMEAINRTQQLIERHMAVMRRFQRTHRGGIVG